MQKLPCPLDQKLHYSLDNVIYCLNKFHELTESFVPDRDNSKLEKNIRLFSILLENVLLSLKKNGKVVIRKRNEAKDFEISFFMIKAILINFIDAGNLVKIGVESSIKLLELLFNFSYDLRKVLDIRVTKSPVKESIDELILTLLNLITKESITSGNIQRAVIYCNIQRDLIEVGEHLNGNRKVFHTFVYKMGLAEIYFNLGYPEVTLAFIDEIHRLIKFYYCHDIDCLIILLFGISKEIGKFYEKKNNLIALKICQDSLELIKTLKKTSSFYSKEDSITIELELWFNKIIEGLIPSYLSEIQNISRTDKIKELLTNVQVDLTQHCLLLFPKEIEYISYMKHVLRSRKVHVDVIKDSLRVDLYRCTPKLLERICQISLQMIESKRKETLNYQEKEIGIQATQVNSGKSSISILQTSPPLGSSFSFFYSENLSPPPQKNKKRKKPKIKEQKNHSDTSKASQDMISLPEIPVDTITYCWPEAGLTYNSEEKNEGTVKMIWSNSNSVPEGLWFGYIPEGVSQNEHYSSEFSARLNRGLLHKNCIRYIKKELETRELQNRNSQFYTYQFKIVSPGHDYRLYGFIEDVYVDPEGGKHFLICFGVLGNHKLKHLPDPETVKKEWQNSKKEIPKQQLPTKDNMNNYIAYFSEIIYDKTLNIPESLQHLLSGFFYSLYDHTMIFDKSGFLLEEGAVLIGLLEKMMPQVEKLGKEELNSEKQLAVLNDIISFLSTFENQKIYQPIVLPLLKAMKIFQTMSYQAINDENSSGVQTVNTRFSS
jgi:hypothetical protein